MNIGTEYNELLSIRNHLNYLPDSSLVLCEKSSDSCTGHVRRVVTLLLKGLQAFYLLLLSSLPVSFTSFSWDHNMRVLNNCKLGS